MMSVVMTTASGERTTRAASVVKNFAEIGGGIGLVIDSFGMLAICANRGSASDELNIAVGDAVTLSALDETASVATSVTTNVELRRSPKGT
jgi:S-adenosylmethionine hydrolase